MSYNEWRDELKNNLLSVSEEERKRVLDYYAEAYADRREAGFSERQIIDDFGAPYDAAQRILGKGDDEYSAPSVSSHETQTKSAPRKKYTWLIIVLCVVFVAVTVLGVFVGVGLKRASVDWNTDTYIYTDVIKAIKIDASAGKIVLRRGSTPSVVIKYEYKGDYKPKIDEGYDGLLIIKGAEYKWYDTSLWFGDAPTIEIFVSEDYNPYIEVVVGTGTVKIGDGDWGDRIFVRMRAGTVNIGNVSAREVHAEVNSGIFSAKSVSNCELFSLKLSKGSAVVDKLDCPSVHVNVSTGSASVGLTHGKFDYTIEVDKRSGNCNVESQYIGTTYGTLNIRISSGAVEITFDN